MEYLASVAGQVSAASVESRASLVQAAILGTVELAVGQAYLDLAVSLASQVQVDTLATVA